MAHVIVEVTSPISSTIGDGAVVLRQIHSALEGVSGLHAEDFKGRIVVVDEFSVGTAPATGDGFVAIEVQTFAGKTSDDLDLIVDLVLAVATDAFAVHAHPGRFDVSVRVTELDPRHYGRTRSAAWPDRQRDSPDNPENTCRSR